MSLYFIVYTALWNTMQ